MLVKDDQTVTLHMKSSTFWCTSTIKSAAKQYDQPPNIQYKKDNLKRLNLNYNKNNNFKFNEKVKTSKKTFRNNR